MSVVEQAKAVRSSVTLTDSDQIAVVRVGGDEAFEMVDAVCPRNLFVQDSQALQTVFLNPDGTIFADVELCRDDEEFLVFAEGPTASELVEYLKSHVPQGIDVSFETLTESMRLLSLNGPYAWELLAELSGPEVIGLPYLSLAHDDEWLVFRSGKTGEYGYHLLIDSDRADAIRERIVTTGARFDLVVAQQEALDLCSLETGFLCIRREGKAGISPVEMQLQWRLSADKAFVGADAVSAVRALGQKRRTTLVVAAGEIGAGDPIQLEGETVGHIVAAAVSPVLSQWVGIALLDIGFAHPGIDAFVVATGRGDVAISTRKMPLLQNRSLYVNPQHDSYFTRESRDYPPVIP